MNAKEAHCHPQNPQAMVVGRRLQPGEKVQKGDMNDDPMTKEWELVPDFLVGYVVGVTWTRAVIRPTEQNVQ